MADSVDGYGCAYAPVAVQDGLRPKGYGQGRVVVRPVCLRDARRRRVFRVVPVAVVRRVLVCGTVALPWNTGY